MQQEAATVLIEHTLNHLCKLASLCLHKLKSRHLFCLRTNKAHISSKLTCFKKIAKICPTFTETSNPLLEPKLWEPNLLWAIKECIAAIGGVEDKKQEAQNFNSWLSTRNPDDIVVSTHRSQWLDKTKKIAGTGSAWTIGYKGQWVDINRFSLDANIEIYDAEIIGLCGGLKVTLSSLMAELASEIYICINNLNIAKKAESIPNGLSQAASIRFKEGVKSWV